MEIVFRKCRKCGPAVVAGRNEGAELEIRRVVGRMGESSFKWMRCHYGKMSCGRVECCSFQ